MPQHVKGAIVDLATLKRVSFQYNPDRIGDSKDSNISELQIPGQSDPFKHWTNGQTRKFEFSINLKDGKKIKEQARWLRSLQYPRLEDNSYPLILFTFGDLINSRCVIKSAKADWHTLFTPSLSPRWVQIDLLLWEVAGEEYQETYEAGLHV